MPRTPLYTRAVCPEGHNITGTLEVVYGVAGFAGRVRIDQRGKVITPDYDGYTEIAWDSQQTVTREWQDAHDADGTTRVFTCDTGDTWGEDQLLGDRAWARMTPGEREYTAIKAAMRG